MKTDSINEKLIDAIKDRIPQKTAIANTLAEILFIEKEAVYRRLRGEVSFSFAEVATISNKLDISLDNIVGAVLEKSKPFQLKLVDYVCPTEEDYRMLEYMPNFTDNNQDLTGSEYGAAMNMIPITLSVKYEYVLRFYIFKWLYQNHSPGIARRFKDIQPDPGIYERLKHFPRIASYAAQAFYIWDEMVFHYIVNDILYFNAIQIITDEERKILRNELLRLLDEIEDLAINGVNDLGNKVSIYISNVSFETSYSYAETKDFVLTMIMAFTMNQVASIDRDTFVRIKQFMQSLKRTSTLITESGEIYRIKFFKTQREIINQL